MPRSSSASTCYTSSSSQFEAFFSSLSGMSSGLGFSLPLSCFEGPAFSALDSDLQGSAHLRSYASAAFKARVLSHLFLLLLFLL